MNILLIITAALCIVLAVFAGKLVTLLKGESFLARHMALFASFSAGIFAVIIVGNISEAAEHLGLMRALLVGVFGFLVVHAVEFFLPEAHHHHAPDADHTHSKKSSWKIQVADALHNTIDGIALVAAFAMGVAPGIKMTTSVFVHEYVQETGEYFALRATGLNERQALWQNFLVALTIFIGIGFGLYATQIESLAPWIFALTSGAYASVVVKDLLPHGVAKQKAKKIAWYLGCFVLGIVIMLAIGALFPHEHGDAHGHDETHQEEISDAAHRATHFE